MSHKKIAEITIFFKFFENQKFAFNKKNLIFICLKTNEM